MGRITTRRPVYKVTVGGDSQRRVNVLAVEEPLEIRVGGSPLAVAMRTPGNNVELAAGFLLSEGIVADASSIISAIHCGGPGVRGEENTYNVLDVTVAPHARVPASRARRQFLVNSSCGVCGKASIDEVQTQSQHLIDAGALTVDAGWISTLPDRLRAEQAAFDKTGGLHAAALFDAETGDVLVAREDVGRHNAVDKVLGWAVLNERVPLGQAVLQVSGRTSFELVQKAAMAGVPLLAAVSAPSSLAVDLADRAGVTLVGFARGASYNVYAHAHRIRGLIGKK